MRRTRLSLYYPTAYLLGSGAGLLVAPGLTLRLLLSDGSYGDVMPRMAGVLALALGILVFRIARLEISSLYYTLVWLRLLFCAVWLILFCESRDPFFLVVFGVVAAGMIWTIVAHRLDAKEQRRG